MVADLLQMRQDCPVRCGGIVARDHGVAVDAQEGTEVLGADHAPLLFAAGGDEHGCGGVRDRGREDRQREAAPEELSTVPLELAHDRPPLPTDPVDPARPGRQSGSPRPRRHACRGYREPGR